MKVSMNEAKTNILELLQLLIDSKEDSIIIVNSNEPVIQMAPYIKKDSQRIGIAKKEMSSFDLSLEEFNSI